MLFASNPSLPGIFFGDQGKRECGDQHKNRHLPLAVTHHQPGQITSFSKCIIPLLFGHLSPNRHGLRNFPRQTPFLLCNVREKVGLSWGTGICQLERGHRALSTRTSVSSPIGIALEQAGYMKNCARKKAVEVFQKTEMCARDRMVRLTVGAHSHVAPKHLKIYTCMWP